MLEEFPIRLYCLMCVESLLFKFNSDQNPFTRLFILVFAHDCILSLTNGGRLLWWWVGFATFCVQGSEQPITSRVVLCQLQNYFNHE